MAIKYFDICDVPYKWNSSTGEIWVLKKCADGSVSIEEPTNYEAERFDRNWFDSSVISEEIAYKLALDPALSY